MTTEERLFTAMLTTMRLSAQHVTQDALNIGRTAQRIVSRYPFETEAEGAMAEAEIALATALDQVRQARADYAAKPVEIETADVSETVEMLSMQAAE
jgi:hypothetical protein